MSVDAAHSAAKVIIEDVEANSTAINSEEDTKLQIITRLLTEALGWAHADIGAEVRHDNGFSDYLLSRDGVPAIIVEAKRRGSITLQTAQTARLQHYKLSGPVLKDAVPGIKQAAAYAQPNGTALAVLTDGTVWIIFKPHVLGAKYIEMKAFVFPSPRALLDDFSAFFELLSREHFGLGTYRILFDSLHNPRTLLSRPLTAPYAPPEIRLSQKSPIAFDLERVFETFFSHMRGDDDCDFIIDCFVETRESRIADFSLEKLTTRILGNIGLDDATIDAQLNQLISDTLAVEGGESIFLVGPTGSGKSTFLDRFFRRTLSRAVRAQVVPIWLNCLDATGSTDTVLSWMTEQLIMGIEKSVYADGSPTWEDLRGLYFSEYQKRRKGVDAKLYTADRTAFYHKFSDYIDKQLERGREEYLRRLLADLVNNRKKLPVFIIDNTDEFSIEYRAAMFQFVQSLRRRVRHCMIIHPITDKSAWSFGKTPIFGIYSFRSFFLPTPPPREVFRKRIEYIKSKLREKASDRQAAKYFSESGIRISIADLANFATILEDAFVNNAFISRTLGEVSNYNIRRTLLLARRIMTSAVFSIEDLLVASATHGISPISPKDFMNALLKGDYEMYHAGDVGELTPIFQVDDRVIQSPLLQLRILALLDATANAAREVESKHLDISSLYSYFEVLGCTEVAFDRALAALVENQLIESYDPTMSALSREQKVAIKHAGRAHFRIAQKDSAYFEQMALTTAIADKELARRIKDAYCANQPVEQRLAVVRTLFSQFLVKEDREQLHVPDVGEQFDCQRVVSAEISAYAAGMEGKGGPLTVSSSLLETSWRAKTVSGVIATVDFFSKKKGFGFAESPEVDGRIFVRIETLKNCGIDTVQDGDELLCDVEFGKRGPAISRVVDLQTWHDNISVERCRVVRLFHDRRYGFVRPMRSHDEGGEAFFHFSLVEDDQRHFLQEGTILDVEIHPDTRGGRGPQVRRIISLVSSPA